LNDFLPSDNIVDYENINPIKYVPAFLDGDFVVSDSLAIILVRCSSVIFLIYRHLNSIDKLLAFLFSILKTSILNTLFCLKISKRKLLICRYKSYPRVEKFHGMKLSILMVLKLQTARGSSNE